MKKLILLLSVAIVSTVFASEGSYRPENSGSVVLSSDFVEKQEVGSDLQRPNYGGRSDLAIVDLNRTWIRLEQAARVIARESELRGQAADILSHGHIPQKHRRYKYQRDRAASEIYSQKK